MILRICKDSFEWLMLFYRGCSYQHKLQISFNKQFIIPNIAIFVYKLVI